MLSKDQFKILESLSNIEIHNSNKKNLKIKFQLHKFNNSDIQYLLENKYIKMSLSGDLMLTDLAYKVIRDKY